MSAPERTCIGCRRAQAKAMMIRLVRSDDGRVMADPGGSASGRGAYACPDPECLGKALGAGRLAHAFRAASQPPLESAAEILETWRRR